VSSASTIPIATLTEAGEAAPSATPEPPKTRKKRGADPAAAVAPPPIPVPSAAPTPPTSAVTPPSLALPADGGIPAFLDRTAGAPPAAQTPPPPAPPPLLPQAPALVPAAPNFALGNKVADVLEAKAAAAIDKGASLVTWLQHPGLGSIVRNDPSVTFEEAVAVVRMTTDDKIATAAGLLQVS
jgi:hypothetical protein